MSDREGGAEFATQAALQAVSHPLRLDIIEYLRRNSHARAADIAAATGKPANSISYHLRTLAAAELVAEAPELARDKRDRVWRLATHDRALSADIEHRAPEYRQAVDQVGIAGIEWIRAGWMSRVGMPLANERREPFAVLNIATARMTPGEAGQFIDELTEVVHRYAALHRDEEGRDSDVDDPKIMSYRIGIAAITPP